MYNPLWRQRFLIHWFMFMCLTVFKKIWKFDRALSTGTDPPSISCWVNLLVPNKLSYLFPKGWTTKPINNESKICFCYIFRRNVQYFRAQRPFYINIYLFITKWYGRNGDKVGGWQLRCRISVTLAKACSTTGLLLDREDDASIIYYKDRRRHCKYLCVASLSSSFYAE
jgi:hypothetical protein